MSRAAPRLGIVTIGQAPRVDLHDDLGRLLDARVAIVERGALDGLTLAEIETRHPVGDKRPILVSRMADGQQVTIAEPDLEPRLAAAVTAMAAEDDVDAIVVLCTGDLPTFTDLGVPVLSPKRIVAHGLQALFPAGELIVMSPEASQIENTRARWQANGFTVTSLAGSPYGQASVLDTAARQARELAGDTLYLDCMGYTLAHRARIAELSRKRVITPRQLVFGAAAILL